MVEKLKSLRTVKPSDIPKGFRFRTLTPSGKKLAVLVPKKLAHANMPKEGYILV